MCKSVLLLIAATLLTLVTLTVGNEVLAAPSSLEQRVIQLQNKYQQLRSLEFDFDQSTRTGGRLKLGAGHAVFYRVAAPGSAATGQGIMRWNYTRPTEQTIINDGETLSIHAPLDNQLIVTPAQDMESDITYGLLTGRKDSLDAFVVAPADPRFQLSDIPPADTQAVQLTPKNPHPQLKRVQLWLQGDLIIHRLLMEDHFGALTELTFTNVRVNTLDPKNEQQAKELLERLQKLSVPPGTEIIRQ